MAVTRRQRMMKRRRVKRKVFHSLVNVLNTILGVLLQLIPVVLRLVIRVHQGQVKVERRGCYVLGRDTTTLRSRARRLIHPVFGANSLARWIDAGIGRLANDLFLNEDLFRRLFRLCLPWLQLPQWLSDSFYDRRVVEDLADCQHRAGLSNPFGCGRPRDAATSGDRFLIAWRTLRAIQYGHDPNCEASYSTTFRALQHALWAIYNAISAAGTVALPTDQELAHMYTALPLSFRNALHGVKLWGSIDGTLIRVLQSMLSRVHLKSQYYTVKRDGTGRGSVVFADNALAHLLVVDIYGRIRFMDTCQPGSIHDVRQLRACTLPHALRQFPIDVVTQEPVYKIAADDGFRGIGNGLDAHFQLRRGYPLACPPHMQPQFIKVVEFFRASVEHVNHDFKNFAPACVAPHTTMPLKRFAAIQQVSLLIYAFFRYDQPLHHDRWADW